MSEAMIKLNERSHSYNAGSLKPQGMKERMAAGFLAYPEGQSWANTPRAQSRLEAWIKKCLRRKGFSV